MLTALLVATLTAVSADTFPVSITVASASLSAPTPAPAIAPATAPAIAPMLAAMTPLARAMARPKLFSADSIVLDKSERRLTMYSAGLLVRTYAVALGKNPVGPKARRGDGRTPEGLYFIEGRNAESKYHLALRISYPNATDRARAGKRGVSSGGDIMIHGLPPAFATVGALHRQQDWTEGCVALTNEEIEEIWRAVPNGAPILIRP